MMPFLTLRKAFKNGRMRRPLAERILLSIKILRNAYTSSYFFALVIATAVLSSYFFVDVVYRAAVLSYLQFFGFLFSVLCCSFFKRPESSRKNDDRDESSQAAEWIEDIGGNGPRVAAYTRVSTTRQAKEGFKQIS